MATSPASDDLAQLIARANASTYTDPLTGIASRSRAVIEIERLIGLAERHRRPMSVVRVDLAADGRPASSVVLRGVARRLAVTTRLPDLPAYWARDAFVVVMPETRQSSARIAARRFSDEARQAGAAPLIASLQRMRGETGAEFVARIDRASML